MRDEDVRDEVQDDDDTIDGCELDFTDEDGTPDENLDGVVLFADVDPNDSKAVKQRKLEYQKLFGFDKDA